MSGSRVRALVSSNRLLERLDSNDRALLSQHLERVDLRRGDTLFQAGSPVEFICFPCDGTILSLMITTSRGDCVEALSVGCEGAVGGVVSRGLLPAFSLALVQSGGAALRMPVTRMQQIKAGSPSIRNLLTRYSDCILAQSLQSTACNALHALDARCARWLLTTQDRIGSDELPVTQELLAGSLGAQRSYVSRVLQSLQQEALIRSARGRIVVVDRAGLQQRSCECYSAIRQHFDRVLTGVYPADRLSGTHS